MKKPAKVKRGAEARRAPRNARTKPEARRKAQPRISRVPKARTSEAAGGENGGRASVRVYCQGLGDCILIRVRRRSGDDFKLLIDCGVVLGTKDAVSKMTRVVEDIVESTKPKLGNTASKSEIDVLAITHEHWDHLSGFTQASDSFEKLNVGEVWVAWTEDPHDELAKQLKAELGKGAERLAACATALRVAGDTETHDMLADIALISFGAAASSSTSTKVAFDKAKGKGNVRMCRPDDKPFEIPNANARIYVLGPPHDPKLIRKINPSQKTPETYGLANGDDVLPFGVLSALANHGMVDTDLAEAKDDRPFHRRMTIPLDPKGIPDLSQNHSANKDDSKQIKQINDFFTEHYWGNKRSPDNDWRRIDGDWLGSATELALALQSYTNNTSLVLALELGDPGKGDILLFAADAQVGNWESWQNWQSEKDGLKVTGPDLLKRTIFYKVGHHGSHNATLKEHGVEQMDALKSAIIPVDEEEAKKKRWGRMPLDDIIAALQKKVSSGMVLRTDKKPTSPPASNVKIGDNYLEVML
jgi:hypothetical protein